MGCSRSAAVCRERTAAKLGGTGFLLRPPNLFLQRMIGADLEVNVPAETYVAVDLGTC